jgi:hypothetical protein
MNPPNCLFCAQPTTLLRNHAYNDIRQEDFECHPCHARFNHDNEVLVYYYFDYGQFRLTFWPEHPNSPALFTLVNTKGLTTSSKYVLTFTFLPNLTPQNISAKLPVILTFL